MEKGAEDRGERLYLRDHLAAYRTVLANERTFLAYTRTALTFFVVGVTFVKFFGNVIIEAVGWVLIPLGVVTFVKGVSSYRKAGRLIRLEEEGAEPVNSRGGRAGRPPKH